MFSALAGRNFRLYFFGQLVGLSGNWMQGVAMGLLALELGAKGTDLGLLVSCQFLPLLLLGAASGALIDRFDKRRVLMCTQAAASVISLIIGTLVLTGAIELWMLFVLATCVGTVGSVDNPARQSIVYEVAGPDHLTNAVSLNSVATSLGRAVGPALAGVFALTVGLAPCFLFNSVSYWAVIASLVLMRTSELHSQTAARRHDGGVRDGLRYVRSTPELLTTLLLLGVIGTLAWEFQVSLPLMARTVFDSPELYSAMVSIMGVGAIVGGLYAAAQNRASGPSLAIAAVLFGVTILAAATAPTAPVELVVMVPMGAAAVTVLALGSATLQLRARPDMRGRVVALWSIAFFGSTPIGGPAIGWIGDQLGARVALAVGGISALLAGVAAYPVLARQRTHPRDAAPTTDDDRAGHTDGAAAEAIDVTR